MELCHLLVLESVHSDCALWQLPWICGFRGHHSSDTRHGSIFSLFVSHEPALLACLHSYLTHICMHMYVYIYIYIYIACTYKSHIFYICVNRQLAPPLAISTTQLNHIPPAGPSPPPPPLGGSGGGGGLPGRGRQEALRGLLRESGVSGASQSHGSK